MFHIMCMDKDGGIVSDGRIPTEDGAVERVGIELSMGYGVEIHPVGWCGDCEDEDGS